MASALSADLKQQYEHELEEWQQSVTKFYNGSQQLARDGQVQGIQSDPRKPQPPHVVEYTLNNLPKPGQESSLTAYLVADTSDQLTLRQLDIEDHRGQRIRATKQYITQWQQLESQPDTHLIKVELSFALPPNIATGSGNLVLNMLPSNHEIRLPIWIDD